MSDDDLEAYWSDVRAVLPKGLEKSPTIDKILEEASKNTAQQLAAYANEKYARASITGEVLADIIAKGTQLFVSTLMVNLRSQTTTAMFEVILEGQKLSAPDLKSFVRALPIAVIERAVEEGSLGGATGVHALLAVEYHHRQSNDPDYTLEDGGNGLRVVLRPPRLGGKMLTFRLDETFQSDPSTSGVDNRVAAISTLEDL